MSKYTPTEDEKNEAYAKGLDDAKAGKFDPPKENIVVDILFAPIDPFTGDPSTKEVADAKAESYRAGHSSGSQSKK